MNGPELRDIHLPDPVSWWPLAPGWWLLLVLLAIAITGIYAYRRWRGSTRRRSLRELARLRAELDQGLAERDAIDRVAALLRRVLICHRGREGFAASSGDLWIAQLGELAPLDEQTLGWLGSGRYRRAVDCNVARLLDASEAWLKSLPWERHRVST